MFLFIIMKITDTLGALSFVRAAYISFENKIIGPNCLKKLICLLPWLKLAATKYRRSCTVSTVLISPKTDAHKL